jgi:hypothetical protein
MPAKEHRARAVRVDVRRVAEWWDMALWLVVNQEMETFSSAKEGTAPIIVVTPARSGS